MKGNSMKIEQAREILSKTKSRAVAIPNGIADKLTHGLTKKACKSCNPMLHYFKTGIEKVIMEDYSDTLEWNPETKQWVDEY